MEIHEGRVFLESLSTDDNRFGLTLGADHCGIGLDLHPLLEILGFRGLLLLNHFGLNGVFQFAGEGDVLNDDVFQDDQRPNFATGDL